MTIEGTIKARIRRALLIFYSVFPLDENSGLLTMTWKENER